MPQLATAISAAMIITALSVCSGTDRTIARCNSNSNFSAVQFDRDKAIQLIRGGRGDAATELLSATFEEASNLLHNERVRRKIVIKDDTSLSFSLGYGEFVRDRDAAGLDRMLQSVDYQMGSYKKLAGCK